MERDVLEKIVFENIFKDKDKCLKLERFIEKKSTSAIIKNYVFYEEKVVLKY